ncbi:hypothetical protein [Acinetobacter sp. Ac_5812]|uniref:hypothetical protein n=1 Tax=Acinetobacter sp. Ac_5812 TaxID=1848937 RepID=UPI001490803C|nr:hypothetical protein [Acinetobacter sp. Ac_5812]NNP70922.1 hypothetical protein [Acinetobacter sp. Ac_5812]
MATQEDISKRIQTAKEAGFSDDQIYSTLANNPEFSKRITMAKREGFSDAQIAQNLGLGIQKDLGTQQPIKIQATRQPYDWKAEQQKAMQEEAKKAGPTNTFQSSLLGGSDLGAGVLQGFSKVADVASSGINKLLGTNLDTNSYDRVTQQRKEINDWHNLRRQANNQGFDWGRLGGQVASTLPLVMTGGGGLGAAVGRGALTGGTIGATSYAKDSNERFNNTALGGVGGAAGGALGTLIGKGATKAINVYKNNLQKGAKEITDLGEKYGVRTSVGDAGRNPHVQRAESALDQVPVIGTSGFRSAQQAEVKGAANKVVDKLRQEMSDVDFKSLGKIQAAAASGDKNATRILGIVNNAGDDSGKVMQAAAEIKNWRGSQIASQMYDRVGALAGNTTINPSKTITAIDNVISKDSKVVPNQELIKEISSIKTKLNDPSINTSFGELRAARSRLGELVDEWGRQGKSTSGLTQIRTAIDDDIKDFAMGSGKQGLISEYRRADAFYKQLQSNKDKALANSMRSSEPDQIYRTFVQFGKGDKAANFYKNLDPKGQSAIKFEMANRALEKATNESTGVFSPAKFANEFERLGEPYKNIFTGADKAEMDGFIKLMRHVERAGQYAENPANGSRLLMPGAMLATGASAVAAPVSTGFGVAGIYGMSKLFTTSAGKRILLAAKDLPPNSPKLANLLKQAEQLSTVTGANASKD